MPKHTTAAEPTALRFVLVTMDSHLSSATTRAAKLLKKDLPGLELTIHAADEWSCDPDALRRCREDIARADIIVATMLFMEDHFRPLIEALQARREHCDAMVCAMSASEIMRLTRMGRFSMDGTTGGPLALLKRLRGAKSGQRPTGAGAAQLKMLRRIPRLLRFIPGHCAGRARVFSHLAVLAGGFGREHCRHGALPREPLRGGASTRPSFHDARGLADRVPGRGRLSSAPAQAHERECAKDLPLTGDKGCVGVLLLRSYLLAGNSAHYDGVIAALEARGLRVIPAFAAGLDARPAIDKFFIANGAPCIDALVSLTGFSLVGGPAYNDSKAAEETARRARRALCRRPSGRIPDHRAVGELGARTAAGGSDHDGRDSRTRRLDRTHGVRRPLAERRQCLEGHGCCIRSALRHARGARRAPDRAAPHKRCATARSASCCSISRRTPATPAPRRFCRCSSRSSNTLSALKRSRLQRRPSRRRRCAARVDRQRQRRAFRRRRQCARRIRSTITCAASLHLKEIEAQWGPAPGKQQSDGASIIRARRALRQCLRRIQPAFGYEGDPMRLLFEKGLRADPRLLGVLSLSARGFRRRRGAAFRHPWRARIHAGQAGPACPALLARSADRRLPNFYLYASNNPSEGAIAKRRSARR
jgi:magnesium chelatase subunit H